MKESDILYETGNFWVSKERGKFKVWQQGLTHSALVATFSGAHNAFERASNEADRRRAVEAYEDISSGRVPGVSIGKRRAIKRKRSYASRSKTVGRAKKRRTLTRLRRVRVTKRRGYGVMRSRGMTGETEREAQERYVHEAEAKRIQLQKRKVEGWHEDVDRCRARVRRQGGQRINPNGNCPACDGLICGH